MYLVNVKSSWILFTCMRFVVLLTSNCFLFVLFALDVLFFL